MKTVIVNVIAGIAPKPEDIVDGFIAEGLAKRAECIGADTYKLEIEDDIDLRNKHIVIRGIWIVMITDVQTC